ncbi:uncharacterized protein At3g49140-like [Papaver somniferum]|uniref:uncharacterized protein At3g49140-like n=1 Tax=Papaver somniferum TaxID=3469 RepID=UPI000E703687|nr:uncharacterized protein At3g49140-like [Papaver somniferum]
MMMMIESSLAVVFRGATTTACSSSSPLFFSGNIRPWWSTEDHHSTRRLSQAAGSHYHQHHHHWTPTRTNNLEKRIRTAAASSAGSDNSSGWNGEPNYHPFEEFGASTDDSVLTPAETCRTLIEVNSKATLMFSGLVDDQVHENIFWPDLPYLTDEHGNIYFEVNEDEDILKTITSQENYVQVIIGLDTKEMLSEMELDQAEIDYGMEEIGDEDSDGNDDDGGEGDEGTDDDDYDDEDWVSVLEGDEDETDSDETLGDWAKLETMRSSHPMYFAKKMSEVASDDPMDWMDQPPAGLAISGLLRPSFFEENSALRKQLPQKDSDKVDTKAGTANGDSKDTIINGQQDKSSLTDSSEDGSDREDQSGKDETPRSSFYMLEMAKIQLVSSDGNQSVVEVHDFQKSQPDAIAHSAEKIMSRLKAGGEKTTQALKSLCLRVKGFPIEEATVISVDSLGFDLRVCSGTQVQTLRFAFSTRATSEYSAERQFHELLFPRSQQTAQKQQEASPTES